MEVFQQLSIYFTDNAFSEIENHPLSIRFSWQS